MITLYLAYPTLYRVCLYFVFYLSQLQIKLCDVHNFKLIFAVV